MALCRCARDAGTTALRSLARTATDCPGACGVCRSRRRPDCVGESRGVTNNVEVRRRDDPFRLWAVPTDPRATPELGRHEGRLPRPGRLVLRDGVGTRRRVDAGAAVHWQRNGATG